MMSAKRKAPHPPKIKLSCFALKIESWSDWNGVRCCLSVNETAPNIYLFNRRRKENQSQRICNHPPKQDKSFSAIGWLFFVTFQTFVSQPTELAKILPKQATRRYSCCFSYKKEQRSGNCKLDEGNLVLLLFFNTCFHPWNWLIFWLTVQKMLLQFSFWESNRPGNGQPEEEAI